MGKIVTCKRCGRNRVHQAKGLCASCYTRTRQIAAGKDHLKRHAATERRRRKRLGDTYRQKERERNRSPKRRAWKKAYYQSESGKKTNRRGSQRDRKVNPAHTRARQAIRQEVKTGRMPSPRTLTCKHCGKPSREYHHHKGYFEEHKLDVIPLCKSCHIKAE